MWLRIISASPDAMKRSCHLRSCALWLLNWAKSCVQLLLAAARDDRVDLLALTVLFESIKSHRPHGQYPVTELSLRF
jgi:hypothetical protein